MSESGEITVTTILVEVLIDVPRDEVWRSMVVRTSEWWHEDFYTRPGMGSFFIQEKLDGWMYEDWGGGEGQIWGRVNGLKRPEFLQIVGDSDKDWGGPSRGIMTFRLDEQGSTTRLRFEHSLFGRVSRKTHESLEEGWSLLFRECLKPFCETGRRAEGIATPERAS